MAVAGRKPKPAQLRILEGNPGHRPINDAQPKPQPIAPKCPGWLELEAKREWRRVAPELERLGLLTGVDMAALAGYCQAWARWIQAEKAVTDAKSLSVATSKGYLMPLPEVAIARQMMVQMRAFCAEFGLTPSSRGRLTIPGGDDGDEDTGFDV